MKPFELTDLGDGRFSLNINVRSEEELRTIVPHIAARLKTSEEQVWQQLAAVEGKVVQRRANPVHFPLSFGGADAIRSIAKSCLVLLAIKAGTEALRLPSFAEARNFVLLGDAHFNLTRCSLDVRPLPVLAEFQAGYGPFFNLVYVRSDAVGRMIGHFTLYNLIAWQVVLAETGGPTNLRAGLISNPLKPAEWSDKISGEFDIDFEWLNSPDHTSFSERAQERFGAAMQYYVGSSRERETGRIIDDVLRQHFHPGQALDISEEATQLAIAEISARVARMVMDVPLERPFRVTPPNPKAGPSEAE